MKYKARFADSPKNTAIEFECSGDHYDAAIEFVEKHCDSEIRRSILEDGGTDVIVASADGKKSMTVEVTADCQITFFAWRSMPTPHSPIRL